MKKFYLIIMLLAGVLRAAEDIQSAALPEHLSELHNFVTTRMTRNETLTFGVADEQEERFLVSENGEVSISSALRDDIQNARISLPQIEFEIARAHGMLEHRNDKCKLVTCHETNPNKTRRNRWIAAGAFGVAAVAAGYSIVPTQIYQDSAWAREASFFLTYCGEIATIYSAFALKKLYGAQFHFSRRGQIVEAAEVDAAQSLETKDLEALVDEQDSSANSRWKWVRLNFFNTQHTLLEAVLRQKKAAVEV